ncbi:PAS domain-containing hybrid sensor histidine kinase/response regulator [Candidatus Methanoperedens nitratireducens]|uniref:PAS/PAC sensor hybrid histidine kinase (Modular protein) n=1 Tax=Candidatus Methanoperedens nitratireducens TaxID=1392998 RepID=A0A284VU77_9EURY|nr:PAS domain-containing hybrid sensor histidine kinase/response regulator [Candidatus Methanoperedens nitroreducens]SNQ62832.1 PAS/PAC sensor hybrid histidine kinase (modular protein) [Candidatus Methanoperedens nitroreducens]
MVKDKDKTKEQLVNELAELRRRTAELERSDTQHKRAEEAMGESEASYRSLVESARDVIFTISTEGTITSLNPAFETITGWSRDEWLGKNFKSLFHPDDLPFIKEIYQCILKGEIPSPNIELRILSKSGEYVMMEYSIKPQTQNGKAVGAFGIARDITERRRSEDQIREQATFLRKEIIERKQVETQIREQAALLDKAQDAIIVRDFDHCLIYWNKGAERLYGWTAEETIGKNTNELLYKEESPRLIEAQKSVMAKGEWTGELHQVTKDSKDIDVESRWTLVRDNRGKQKSILIINTDITEKKKLEAQFLRAQRMESIGTLAGGIAHDLNNVLTPIMLSLQMLNEKLKDEQGQKLLAILETNAQRGANLVKQVMSFARGIEGERNVLQATSIITEIVKIANGTFPKYIEIRTDVQKDIWAISGDATQLHQVLMNLCVNARDAMQFSGILSISAENFLVDENFARMNIDAKAGPYIVISVSDTGTGIPPKILDRIFEPFFTTKEHGKGTGLGLSTALAIVKSHSGFINVYSEVGKGTSFKVYFPATTTSETQKAEEQLLELVTGHGELILVVEDEASISEITSSTLEAHGYKVITAEDGTQAVALYAQNMDKIKVTLMDMMMPVMDGQTSSRAIRRISPEAKIIAVSGLTDEDRLAKVADYSNAFLPKPYNATRLLKTIHEVLSAE